MLKSRRRAVMQCARDDVEFLTTVVPKNSFIIYSNESPKAPAIVPIILKIHIVILGAWSPSYPRAGFKQCKPGTAPSTHKCRNMDFTARYSHTVVMGYNDTERIRRVSSIFCKQTISFLLATFTSTSTLIFRLKASNCYDYEAETFPECPSFTAFMEGLRSIIRPLIVITIQNWNVPDIAALLFPTAEPSQVKFFINSSECIGNILSNPEALELLSEGALVFYGF
ncbi:uncharacterized protein BDR25DRAFT_361910 [Lindgomyces ingoldianus]|uniref:Uncharacterized protein n=1 Tax=Lindgomyces ingoldianus TaxID=673940 RepID=A0ACB6QDE5_9PLEO|nr:uncharacterized protein BDR25DRAFT_361910 [Lindgomyces ingoldianus]KAF2464166.1 hypothetical protein BDR25DRAFT_361910 [Lindgomyces ingoldianus]